MFDKLFGSMFIGDEGLVIKTTMSLCFVGMFLIVAIIVVGLFVAIASAILQMV